MKLNVCRNLFLWAVLTASQATLSDDRIAIHYHERPPYMSTADTGIVFGLTATPAAKAFQSAGIPHYWVQTPSNWQIEILKKNSGRDCSIGWFKNPERETFAKYSNPLYQDKPTIGLALTSNGKLSSGQSIETAFRRKDLRLLVKSGYSYGEYIDKLIKKVKPNILAVTVENVNMLLMLNVDRADYFFIAEDEAEGLIQASGFSQRDYKYIHFTDSPPGNHRYIICSKQVDDTVLEKLNQWLP
ncbi:transporter substrate-binding domain-containing protein [Hahella aquimaris]|uniref:substrate-binding periplasmic protein n=1 Tax=Hahella sp. HNIBRBA332 TaxID=3015983 RepID=UPI00273B7BDB|nr:transporter substrate-binding domain-containing protein [Hahella sp. HNIBRBA332]WLQ13298.1 transporter substrate-binding domain-containing protein [Hahella sp. HNIBRBA332]